MASRTLEKPRYISNRSIILSEAGEKIEVDLTNFLVENLIIKNSKKKIDLDSEINYYNEYEKFKKSGTWIIYWFNGSVFKEIVFTNVNARFIVYSIQIYFESGGLHREYNVDSSPTGLVDFNKYKIKEFSKYFKHGLLIEGVYRFNSRFDALNLALDGLNMPKDIFNIVDRMELTEIKKLQLVGGWNTVHSLANDKSYRVGLWKTFHESGQLKSEGNYKDGKQIGLWKTYHENGQLREEGYYNLLDGMTGSWKKYHSNGKLSHEGKYKFGKEEGVHITLYENEQHKEEGNYKDGKTIDLWKTFYENGQLKSEGNYKDGKTIGLWKNFHENGQLKSEGNYKDGKTIGLWKTFHENGQLKSEGDYEDGKTIGLWKTFHKNEQLKSEGNYNSVEGGYEHLLDGKTGLWKTFYENGQLKEEGDYNNGKTGLWKTFHENGQLREEGIYMDGLKGRFSMKRFSHKIGLWKTFHENGQLREEGEFKNGQKTGVWKTLDKDNGNKFCKTYYYLGQKRNRIAYLLIQMFNSNANTK
jgi:antitoxin component YwqK of YwqJK toxin-antitoxin module